MIDPLLLAPWSGRRRFVERLAAEVAQGCQTEVCPMVRAAVAHMSPAEARGYLRARTGELVARRVSQLIGRHELPEHYRGALIHQAQAVLVEQVLALLLADQELAARGLAA